MDKIIKEVVKRIANTDITEPVEVMGEIVEDILFKTEQDALYIDNDTHQVFLLMPTEGQCEKKQTFLLRLSELLAVFQKLEKDGMIYIDEVCLQGQSLFYQGKEFFEQDQQPGIYCVAKGVTLHAKSKESITLEIDGKGRLAAVTLSEQIGTPLGRLMCSSVLPTKSLKEYVERGFRTKEERNTQLGLRYSVVSMTIAVVVAAVSPFFSVLTANHYGFSTINKVQMDSLVHAAKPVYVIENRPSILNRVNMNDTSDVKKGNAHGKY